MKTNNFKVGDKVFVSEWGKQYSSLFKYDSNNTKVKVFNWKSNISDNYTNNTAFHWKREYTPKLTLKGKAYANGDKIMVSETALYLHYKFEILEIITHSPGDKIIYLLSSDEGLIVQIGEGGISTLTPEQYKDEMFNSFIAGNLKKWSIDDDLKQVPEQIITKYYDNNGLALFGTVRVNSSIKYKVINGRFTKDGVAICIGTSCLYDGGEEANKANNFITWEKLKNMCTNQKFAN